MRVPLQGPGTHIVHIIHRRAPSKPFSLGKMRCSTVEGGLRSDIVVPCLRAGRQDWNDDQSSVLRTTHGVR
jgi:hypothetical protein